MSDRLACPNVRRLGAPLFVGLLSASASAQVVNPAEAQKPPVQAPPQEPSDEYAGRLRSWELPATIVTGERLSQLREEDRVGDYGQPRWTAHRVFPTTRVYVVPPGKFELEHWTRSMTPHDGGPTTVETQYEAEFGLPGRFQIDLYAVTEKTGSEGTLEWAEQKFELRYAFADWGELWGNPTAYLEWVERSAQADVVEAKLLLGGEVSEGWHWGSNLVLEHTVADDLANEWGLTLGISHTIRDEKLSLGAELKTAFTDVHDDRGDFTSEVELGPSLQWRPVPPMHIDFAPLFGLTSDSRKADIFLVLGWEI